jgi:hypothetical protein
MINKDFTAEYTRNLANMIRDVRKDLDAPDMKVVIGELGVGGLKDVNSNMETFRKDRPRLLARKYRGPVGAYRRRRYAAGALVDIPFAVFPCRLSPG